MGEGLCANHQEVGDLAIKGTNTLPSLGDGGVSEVGGGSGQGRVTAKSVWVF